MSYITKIDQIKELNVQDLDNEAQELILNQPKFKDERFNSRKKFLDNILDECSSHRNQKVLLPLLDLIGQGGHNDLGSNYGGRSERLPVFACLGKGRKNASDGGVWDAHLRDLCNGLSIGLDKTVDEEYFIVICKDDVEEIFFYPESSGDQDCHDSILISHEAQKCAAALFGQLLIALTRDQQYIALVWGDNYFEGDYSIAYQGLKIGDSLRSPEGIKLVGELYSHYKNL